MKKEIELFLVFFKIGAFTLGGGYAMVPLIQDELVHKKKWLGEEEFLDSLAIAQSSPGVLAVNTAIITGHRISKKIGMLMAVLGAVLPSFFMILALSTFLIRYQESSVLKKIFYGVKPATVALIFISLVKLSKTSKLQYHQFVFPIVVAALIAFLKISPIWIILASIVLGNLYLSWKDKKKGEE